MRHAKIVVCLQHSALLTQSRCVLAQRRDATANRGNVLAKGEGEPLDTARVELPTSLGQSLISNSTGAEHDTVLHSCDAAAPVRRDPLRLEPLRPQHPTRRRPRTCGLEALGWHPAAVMGDERGAVRAESLGETPRHAVRRQHALALVPETLRHGERTLAHVNRQDHRGHRVHRHPDPMRGTRQACDRFRLADLSRFDSAAQGEPFIHLPLRNVAIASVRAGDPRQRRGGLDSPAQDRLRIALEDAGAGADTASRSESRHGPYPLVRITLLSVKRRPYSFKEIAVATATHALAPASTMRMTVGADIPEVNPAGVCTGDVGTASDRSDRPGGAAHECT